MAMTLHVKGSGDLDLGALAREMVTARVKRLAFSDVEIELHDSAFASPVPVVEAAGEPPKPESEPPCPCGHDLHTDHTNDGCLHGCRVELCASKQNAEE